MIKDGDYIYISENQTLKIIFKSICCKPETNIALYVI